MSTRVQSVRYNQYRTDFLTATKRVLKTQISLNRQKHIEYATAFTNTYNIFTVYAAQIYDRKEEEEKNTIRTDVGNAYERVIESFRKINITINLEKKLGATISERDVLSTFTEEELKEYNEKQEEKNGRLEREQRAETDSEDGSVNNGGEEIENNNETMAMTNIDFLGLASRTINRNYNGDPLALNAFTNSIDLLNDVCTDALKPLFVKFIKSKLEGKALECIPTDATTVIQIKDALKERLKPDSSKVIAGRILALKPEANKLTEFSEKAETLADALQRALIIEGIPQVKACEMTIEKTTELCRSVARSDLVKSVLASSKFESPKEVVAKYVTENATEKTEKQILAFKKNNYHDRNNDRFRRGGFRGNGRGRGRYRGGGRHSTYNDRGGNREYRNDNNRGNNTRYNGNRGGYYRNNNNNRNNYTGPERNIRYAENAIAPRVSLGDAQVN